MTEKLQTQDSGKGLPQNPSRRHFIALCIRAGAAGAAIVAGASTNLGTVIDTHALKEHKKSLEELKRRNAIAELEKQILGRLSDDPELLKKMTGIHPRTPDLNKIKPTHDVNVQGNIAAGIAFIAYVLWQYKKSMIGQNPEKRARSVIGASLGLVIGQELTTRILEKRLKLEVIEAQANVLKWTEKLLFDEKGIKRDGITITSIRLSIRDKIESLTKEQKDNSKAIHEGV